MPIYEYRCSACGHRTDILHGVNDPAPHFCPECGAEGTLRKAFAPPAIHFKGSGWAKKDRGGSTKGGRSKSDGAKDADGASAPKKEEAGTKAAGKASEGTSSTSTGGD